MMIVFFPVINWSVVKFIVVVVVGWCPGRAMYVVWELWSYDDDIQENVLEAILDDMSDDCIPILYV